MKYYSACLLNDDGTHSTVQFGGGTTERIAARVALEQANLQRRHMCVVEEDSLKGTAHIVQRIEYRNEIAWTVQPVPERPDKKYFGPILLTDEQIPALLQACIAEGYTLTITRATSGDPGHVNIVAVHTPTG